MQIQKNITQGVPGTVCRKICEEKEEFYKSLGSCDSDTICCLKIK